VPVGSVQKSSAENIQRCEYLADAGSVELTKNPEALISALRKISGNAQVPHVPSEVRQMFIENPPTAFSLFDTHPPLAKRIERLREIAGIPVDTAHDPAPRPAHVGHGQS